MTDLNGKQIAFLGGGHITEILLDKLLGSATLAPEQIVVSSRGQRRLAQLGERFGIAMMQDNVAAARRANMIVVAVRPDVVSAVVEDLVSAELSPTQLIISLAAGTPFSRYERLSNQQPLIRAMPNPPSRIGQGLIALCLSPHVTGDQREQTMQLFAPLGQIVEVHETQLDLITSLTSPVTTLLFLQSLINAGISGGLAQPLARQIASQTVLGTLNMWQASTQSAEALIAEASTPGGISAETLTKLRKLGFNTTVMAALAAGAARAQEIAKSEG